MTQAPPLESLRALLHEPPAAAIWGSLIELFDALQSDLPLSLDYACEHLDAAWPDALRVLPPHWLHPDHPGLRLGRALFCVGIAGLDDLLPPLLASPHLQRLTHVHLAFCELADPDTLRTLQRAPACATHLTHLTLRGIDISVEHARALLDPDLTAPLQHLALIDAYLNEADLDALLESPRLASLQSLDLTDNTIPPDHPIHQRFP